MGRPGLESTSQRFSEVIDDTMDEEKLTLEVESHTIIYDVTHPFYKDTHKKASVWNAISAAVGVDGELIITDFSIDVMQIV